MSIGSDWANTDIWGEQVDVLILRVKHRLEVRLIFMVGLLVKADPIWLINLFICALLGAKVNLFAPL